MDEADKEIELDFYEYKYLQQHPHNNNNKQKITINQILKDNWDTYQFYHKSELRDVEIKEVEKTITCQDNSRGYAVYECSCGEIRIVHFGCNSRLCTHCGKKYTDKWAKDLSNKTFDVKHRHVVLTIPDTLRPFFEDWKMLKLLMDVAIKVVKDVIKWKMGKEITPGLIVILHTYGKDIKHNPHLHCLLTEGGFKRDGTWVDIGIFPYKMLRKSWQYQLLTTLKTRIEKSDENSKLIDHLFKAYPDGFYVRAKDIINNKKNLISYLGRYIHHRLEIGVLRPSQP